MTSTSALPAPPSPPRRAIQDLRVVQADQRLQITVSIGVAGCDADMPAPSLDELLAMPPLQPPFENPHVNFMIAVEINIAAGFSWWPYSKFD